MKQLILGGARSGKSKEAEARCQQLAKKHSLKRYYIATAQALDKEMSERITHHQQDRALQQWTTVEEPIALAQTLEKTCSDHSIVLVDCLTLWLSNCLHHQCWDEQEQTLLDCIPTLPGRIIFVSNEVGHGIVPLGELNRQFVDAAGRLHQRLTEHCNRVSIVFAGLSLDLKSS